MFTIDQIKVAHSKVRSGADFPRYIQDLKALGVTGYETFVSDGHTGYHGNDNFTVSSPAKYDTLAIAENSDAATFERGLRDHQQGKTDYPIFCKMCAETGIEKWVVSINEMTCNYYDKAGNMILSEKIPTV